MTFVGLTANPPTRQVAPGLCIVSAVTSMFVDLIVFAAVHRPHHVSRSEQRPALHDWSAVSNCESTQRWHVANPPYFGGLQFDESTWASNGGLAYARRPDLATKARQIAVAERLYAARGAAPWPICGRWIRDAA